MGAKSGTNAQQAQGNQTQSSENSLQGYTSAQSNPQVQALMSQYASGQLPLSSALQQIQGLTGTQNGQDVSGNVQQGAADELASNPLTAGTLASSQVMSNPLNQGLYGANGLAGQAQQNYGNATGNLAQDRQALSGNDPSYGLQQSDLAAYGQGANQIGRQSAMQGQGIAQALAARGLGSGSNGAAISSYAGNYGNQAEQLAGLQNQISQNRINTAQGLAQARNASDLQQQSGAAGLATNLGQLGASEYGTQLGANMSGAENNFNELSGANASAANNQALQQNINNANFSQQQATSKPGFLASLGNGISTGITSGVSSGLSNGISSGISGQPSSGGQNQTGNSGSNSLAGMI